MRETLNTVLALILAAILFASVVWLMYLGAELAQGAMRADMERHSGYYHDKE